jgi:putative transposase
MVTPGAKRDAVAHAREHHGLSERRACNLVGVSRRVIRYRSLRPDDGPLRQRLRELAAERRRFGYRRLGYLLAREGMAPNHKKLLRVYREENLRVVVAVAASAPWARGRRWCCRMGRTSVGRWTSSPTR